MKFLLIGFDESAKEFLDAAMAAGGRLVGVLPVRSPVAMPQFLGVRRLSSLEDVASIGGVDAIIVSGDVRERAETLRFLMHKEPIDLVCAVPCADKADVYYEMGLVRSESRTRILPLMPELAHPALARMRRILADAGNPAVRWIEWTQPLSDGPRSRARFLEGWSWLREFMGEIETLSATGSDESPGRPSQVVASARSQSGLLCALRWMTGAATSRLRVDVAKGWIECELPGGFEGDAFLKWNMGDGERTEQISSSSFGRRMLGLFETMAPEDGTAWTHATRQFELADAIHRSMEKERAISLTYDEFSEAAGFKSIMTATGCGLVWMTLFAGILMAVGVPYIQYFILPILVLFLLMQLFGLVYKKAPATNSADPSAVSAG